MHAQHPDYRCNMQESTYYNLILCVTQRNFFKWNLVETCLTSKKYRLESKCMPPLLSRLSSSASALDHLMHKLYLAIYRDVIGGLVERWLIIRQLCIHIILLPFVGAIINFHNLWSIVCAMSKTTEMLCEL